MAAAGFMSGARRPSLVLTLVRFLVFLQFAL
jgi:hypothetical protein